MNVLIVGLGSIAKKHIAALKKIDDKTAIYALRSSAVCEAYEGVKNIFSLAELETVPVDFAIVSTPTSAHKRTIENLLSLKCPLFIEKPLYHTLAVEDIGCEIEKAGMLTYVACNLRFLECIRFVREHIQETNKKINEINTYCGSYLPDWRQGVDFRKVYSALPEAGGGVHIDLIHEIDYLYWLVGKPESVHRVFRNSSSLEIRAYDYANYCLEYKDFCVSVILNYYRRDAKRSLEIVWDDATWEVDLLKNEVRENNKVLFSSGHSIQDTYLIQMEYFVELVKTKSKKSFNTFAEAYDVLKICLNHDIKG